MPVMAASIIVNGTVGLSTTEAGGTAQFTIVLDTLPTADVTVGLSSDDATEGTVSPTSITFTTGNWSTPQIVTVTGVDDAEDDGDIVYNIITDAATSTDLSYNGFDPENVSVTNIDDDTAGITVDPTSGLVTTEAGGTAQFTIVLITQPTADVTIGLSSDNTYEGTVFPTNITLTTTNWGTPQNVTVTGIDDAEDDGDITYNIITAAATSTDPNYNGMNAADVSLTNSDNDTAGIIVTPTSGLVTTEAGGTAQFTIVLITQPTADVTIGLSSDDTSEGTVSPASVTFTTGNWDSPRTVTVTGENDDEVDGNIAYYIITAADTSTTDTNYHGLDPLDVSLTNSDNDTAGITVTPTSGLVTTEAGGTAQFTIVLDTLPTADVTIGLSSDDTNEGTVSPASVTFTTGNWDSPRTVTVTGVDDYVVDGNIAYTIITDAAISADPLYNDLDPADVSVTNSDDDSAGITINPTTGLSTTEAGDTASFTIVLTTQPTANVTIGLSSDNTDEGMVFPANITFTTANWGILQNVTVTGVDDYLMDGNVGYNIITDAASSADPNFNGIDPADVSLTNNDDDTAGITVDPTSGLSTTEAGDTATFTIVLTTQPTADVSIALSSSDTNEGWVFPANITFSTTNWSTPQTVTVTGVDDGEDDPGAITYNIITAAATSADPNYSGLDPADVGVINYQISDSRCFIATAAYGTPMAEAVDVLRDFRDQYMLTNPMGEALVELYYKTSPPIAEFIDEHPALKPAVRAGLKPVIVMGALAVNTTLAQKIAIVTSMVIISALLVVWIRRRSGRSSIP